MGAARGVGAGGCVGTGARVGAAPARAGAEARHPGLVAGAPRFLLGAGADYGVVWGGRIVGWGSVRPPRSLSLSPPPPPKETTHLVSLGMSVHPPASASTRAPPPPAAAAVAGPSGPSPSARPWNCEMISMGDAVTPAAIPSRMIGGPLVGFSSGWGSAAASATASAAAAAAAARLRAARARVRLPPPGPRCGPPRRPESRARTQRRGGGAWSRRRRVGGCGGRGQGRRRARVGAPQRQRGCLRRAGHAALDSGRRLRRPRPAGGGRTVGGGRVEGVCVGKPVAVSFSPRAPPSSRHYKITMATTLQRECGARGRRGDGGHAPQKRHYGGRGA